MATLIVGGAGFIGSHLVDYHLGLGHKVIAVDNQSSGKISNLNKALKNPNFKYYHSDLLTWPQLNDTLAECELVYNLAAVVGMFNVLHRPIDTLKINIHVTEKLLESIAAINNKTRIILASSSEVYGARHGAMKETDALLIEATNKSHATYPISKLCNEVAGMAYFKEKQLPVTSIRLFNTVGPRQCSRYGMVLPRFVKQALNDEPITIFSNGAQTRCFCDVRDVCSMLYQVTQTDTSIGEVLNLGNDQSITIMNLAKLVKQVTQSKSEFVFKQYDEVYGKEYIDIQNRKPDLAKLKLMINYSIKWQLEDSIKNIVTYIKDEG